MSQDALRITWKREEVDARLNKHHEGHPQAVPGHSAGVRTPGNYVNGANIAGFVKVAKAASALEENDLPLLKEDRGASRAAGAPFPPGRLARRRRKPFRPSKTAKAPAKPWRRPLACSRSCDRTATRRVQAHSGDAALDRIARTSPSTVGSGAGRWPAPPRPTRQENRPGPKATPPPG